MTSDGTKGDAPAPEESSADVSSPPAAPDDGAARPAVSEAAARSGFLRDQEPFELLESLASEQRLRSLLEALDRAQIEAADALTKPGPAGLREVTDVIVRHARHVTRATTASFALRSLSDQQRAPRALDAAPDAAGAQTDDGYSLEVQLRYAERTLADLRLTRARTEGPFSADASKALEMLTERLSSSLEIARLRVLEARETLRLSLLEQVERTLHHAQDDRATKMVLADVARVVVPRFADVCVLHLVRDDRMELQRLVHVDHEREELLAVELRGERVQQRVALCLSELARSREPHLLRLTAREIASADVPYAALTGTLQTTSLIVAPLWARERPLGTICFGRVGRGEDYDLGLLVWAHEIARRCASAFDSAQLVHELREAVQWRENLMATISHDLKSPLSAISLSALSMTPEQPQVERRSSYKQLNLIRRSADHMHHMINDLLSASLPEAGSFRVELRRESAYELADEACALVEPLLSVRSLRLERAFSEELPFVFADREPIQRVFSNLLGNAAKFTPRGGRIRVSVSYSSSRVRFYVSDTGPGIPEQEQARLFERYWKGRKGGAGLGLGLYISQAIVEAHGGRIWIESGSQAGATFCFELSRCDPAH